MALLEEDVGQHFSKSSLHIETEKLVKISCPHFNWAYQYLLKKRESTYCL